MVSVRFLGVPEEGCREAQGVTPGHCSAAANRLRYRERRCRVLAPATLPGLRVQRQPCLGMPVMMNISVSGRRLPWGTSAQVENLFQRS